MNYFLGFAIIGGALFYAYKSASADAVANSETNDTPDIKSLAFAAIQRANQDNYFDPYTIMGQIQTESDFNPAAVGRAGEIGLMQIMPATAIDMGFDPGQLTDPETNIACGMRYLFWIRDYLARYEKKEPSMLEIFSGYNGGVGNVVKGWRALSYYAKIQSNRVFV